MPHNLYLHSALVQSRKLQEGRSRPSARAIQFNTIDSTVALTIAFFINAAILVLAAMVFYGKTSVTVPGGQVVTFDGNTRLDPHRLSDAGAAAGHRRRQHALRGRAAGQRAEQHDHRHPGRAGGDGRLHALANCRPGLRRLITRCLAIAPAVLVIGIRGETSVNDLLNLSQVVLALQLPLAMFPLLHFTSSRKRMGKWKNGWFLLAAGWSSAILITAMDIWGLPDSFRASLEGRYRRLNVLQEAYTIAASGRLGSIQCSQAQRPSRATGQEHPPGAEWRRLCLRGGQVLGRQRDAGHASGPEDARGKAHVVDADDPHLHLASWWERLICRRRSPSPEPQAEENSLLT